MPTEQNSNVTKIVLVVVLILIITGAIVVFSGGLKKGGEEPTPMATDTNTTVVKENTSTDTNQNTNTAGTGPESKVGEKSEAVKEFEADLNVVSEQLKSGTITEEEAKIQMEEAIKQLPPAPVPMPPMPPLPPGIITN